MKQLDGAALATYNISQMKNKIEGKSIKESPLMCHVFWAVVIFVSLCSYFQSCNEHQNPQLVTVKSK